MAIDLFYLNLFGEEKIFLIVVDHGTGLMQAARCANAKSATVQDVFASLWVRPFGFPELVISDLGPEFYGEPFQEFLSSAGTAMHFTDAMSPWKNGKAERAVQTVKSKLKTVLAETSATVEELDLCLSQVTAAFNHMFDRFGYSPNQRVFGKSVRMPGSLLAEDHLDSDLVAEAAGAEMKRTWEIREAAQAAWLKRSDAEAVQRAKRVMSRVSDEKSAALQAGQWVYVWRRTENKFGWVGPGSLVAPCPGNGSWWVNMRGRLWKVNSEQLRPASSEETLGASLAKELHRDLLKQIREGTHTGYQDITGEGPPEGDEQEPELLQGEEPELLQGAEPELLQGAEPELPQGADPELAQGVEDLESMEATTATGEDTSDLPGVSTQEPSRRQSVQSVPPFASEPPSTPRRTIRVDEGSSGTMHFGPMRGSGAVPDTSPYLTATETEVPPSEYLNVTDPDAEYEGTSWSYWASSGPKWIRKSTCGRSFLQASKPWVKFYVDEGEASYCRRDRCMYVSKAKTSFGQVEFSRLEPKEKEVFRQSRAKEFQSLLDNKAVKVLSIEESERFRREHPECILESRFVDRYKPVEVQQKDIDRVKKAAVENGCLEPLELTADTSSPKSRWCVVGWRDPQIHQIERSAPTPSSSAIYTVLQLAATRRWRTFVKDVKTAFLQSRPTNRKTPLACSQPRDEPLPSLDPRQLLVLCTEIYGLVSGPAWWRSTFLQRTAKLGYRVNPFEPCVLILPGAEPASKTRGVLVIEVDDVVECGDEYHRACVDELEKTIKFGKSGKSVNAQECETMYAGRSLKQLKDFSFEMHMEQYVYTRLAPISLSRKVLKKDAAATVLDETEQTQLRGAIAALSWVSRECRPDAAAAASVLASSFPQPTIETVYQANEVIRHLKQHPVKLRIHSIPEEDLRNLLIADSAFDTSGREKSQHGFLLGFTDKSLNAGHLAPVSLMTWRSKRLRRKASSSMLCEALSLSSSTAALEKQDALWASLCTSNFNLRDRQRTDEEVLELQGRATVIAAESQSYRDPRSVLVIDAKSLYDHLQGDQPGECGRSNLEVAVIKESLVLCGGRVRWVPHNLNPSDALTKFPGAHVEPMIRLLKTHRFKISDESDTLAQGKQGSNRLKQGLSTAVSGNYYFWGTENS